MGLYKQISANERELIAQMLSDDFSMSAIARMMCRARSTIKRELERNGYRSEDGQWIYHPHQAQQQSRERKTAPKMRKQALPGLRELSLDGMPSINWLLEEKRPYTPQFGRLRLNWGMTLPVQRRYDRPYCPFAYFWRKIEGKVYSKKYPSTDQREEGFRQYLEKLRDRRRRFRKANKVLFSFSLFQRKRTTNAYRTGLFVPLDCRRNRKRHRKNKNKLFIALSGLWKVKKKQTQATFRQTTCTALKSFGREALGFVYGTAMPFAVELCPFLKNRKLAGGGKDCLFYKKTSWG